MESRSLSVNAKSMLRFLPDRAYIRLYYFAKFHHRCHLRHPETFNEKLQWLKLYDRKPVYTAMVDKYEAKQYVAERIGEEYIIPTLGVWDTFDAIDLDALPQQFVLKSTHYSGGIVVCRDKATFDAEAAEKLLSEHLKKNYYWEGREWPYKNVRPRILAEKYMVDAKAAQTAPELMDYKFYCFDGEAKYLYISKGLENHATASISFLTMNWEFAPFGRSDYQPFQELPAKPRHFEEMVGLAQKLAQGHAFLRVDLYEINEHPYFSELTFTPCAGMMPFVPPEWDRMLGECLILPERP